MKRTKQLIAVLLAMVMVLALPVLSSAKTSSSPIDAPEGSTPVFRIQAGGSSVDFTWDEINGKGDYASVTNTYAARQNGVDTTQEWTGVKLADLLTAAESRLGVSFQADYKVSATAADGFVSEFTVADVKEAANNYMVAPDPCSNYDEGKTYDNSYARILRTNEAANQANIRCITGVRILDADGNDLSSDISAGKKTQGGDVANSVFYIAVKESADAPYKFYYYTKDDLNAYDETCDFKYVDHSVPKTVTGRGASLAGLIADIADADITGDMIVQYAESDGYHADADTPIEDSAYKDRVSWLKESHTSADGDSAAAVNTMICLTSWTKYDSPDENNVDSTEWEDADQNSGYLRAYRQRDDANSAVIKTLMGVVISPSGNVFTGEDGYTLSARSADGQSMRIIEPSTGRTYDSQKVTGLVPGMQYAVKAPEITGAVVSGPDTQTITASEGVDNSVVFTYKENTWLTVDSTDYTLSGFEGLSAFTQTPSADEVSAHGTPYGYYNAMYYRYTGAWLKDLVSGDAILKSADGSTMKIPAADTGKYFIVSGYTASKSSTNVSEGKRYTYALAQPQVIIPGDGTLVGEAEASAEGNKKVTVTVEKLQSIRTSQSGQGSSGGNGGSGGSTEQTTYTVTVPASAENGRVSASMNQAKKDEQVTLTLTPEEGYEVDTVSVKDQDGKEVSLKDNGNGTYSFTMPASAVTVDVTYKQKSTEPAPGDGHEANCPSKAFRDLDVSKWYHEAIDYALTKNYFNGVGEGQFKPDGTMTRAMFVTVLGRVAGADTSKYTAAPFDDVAAGQWYTPFVAWASENGIVMGYDSKHFGLNDPVTREQMAAILYRYAKFAGKDVNMTDDTTFQNFTDAGQVSDYAKDPMIWATGKGLINGMGDSTLAPQKTATRAQVAQIVKNFDQKVQ